MKGWKSCQILYIHGLTPSVSSSNCARLSMTSPQPSLEPNIRYSPDLPQSLSYPHHLDQSSHPHSPTNHRHVARTRVWILPFALALICHHAFTTSDATFLDLKSRPESPMSSSPVPQAVDLPAPTFCYHIGWRQLSAATSTSRRSSPNDSSLRSSPVDLSPHIYQACRQRLLRWLRLLSTPLSTQETTTQHETKTHSNSALKRDQLLLLIIP